MSYDHHSVQQPTVIIHNTNTVVTQQSGSTGHGSTYLWLFLLGFVTFGLTWLAIPVVAIVDACSSTPSTTPAHPPQVAPAPQPVRPPNQLANDSERGYVQRALFMAHHGSYLSEEEYTARDQTAGRARTIGELDRLVLDIPVAIRQRAYYN
jgi:hypothetical protein